MILEQRTLERHGFALASLGMVAVAGMVLLGLAAARGGTAAVEGGPPRRQIVEPSLPGHLSALDEALARRDVSRAVHAWRDAYGEALGSRRWEAMAAVGDAALRVDALAGLPARHPTGFRAEARQAYLKALFRARDAGSVEGVERIADAFASIGDIQMAARARTMAPARR